MLAQPVSPAYLSKLLLHIMELIADCERSAGLKACLVAAQYAGISSSVAVKIDGSLSVAAVVLATSDGEISGRTAVLRYARVLCVVEGVCNWGTFSRKRREGEGVQGLNG